MIAKKMPGRLAKVSFALATMLMVVSGPVGATVTLTMDGVWWQSLTKNEKIIAIQGIQAGISSGYRAGWFNAIGTFKVPPKVRLTPEAAKKSGFIKPPYFSKSFAAYAHELDHWYESHPQWTDILPTVLLRDCFADEPILSRANCDRLGSNADK